jgi:hypothetical protein
MAWVKLDDAILDNPKIIAAGPLGFALHVAAISWCGRNLTDGFIPKRRVPQLLDLPSLQVSETTKVRVLHALTADDLATDLERIGLWHDRGEQWEVHDFLVYNRSKEQVLTERLESRHRMRKSRSGEVPPNIPRSSPAPVPVPVPSERSESLLSIAAVPARRSARAKPKSPWPHGFTLTDALRAFAEEGGLDAELEFQKCKDHALMNGVMHVDWVRAFRYWCRNALEFQARRARR